MGKTLYFPNNNVKHISKELSKRIQFEQKFKLKKNIYLESRKYLIVISKKFIRVLIFDIDNSKDINDIRKEISKINMRKNEKNMVITVNKCRSKHYRGRYRSGTA